MTRGSRSSRRIRSALVLSVVLALPARVDTTRTRADAPVTPGPEASTQHGSEQAPLWQFETGG